MADVQLAPTPATVPAWTIYDRMNKARDWARIKSLDVMAQRLTAHLLACGFELTGPLNASTVGAWERGTNQPNKLGITQLQLLAAWAAVTNVELDWLERGVGTVSTWSSPLTLVSNTVDHRPTQLQFPETPRLSLIH